MKSLFLRIICYWIGHNVPPTALAGGVDVANRWLSMTEPRVLTLEDMVDSAEAAGYLAQHQPDGIHRERCPICNFARWPCDIVLFARTVIELEAQIERKDAALREIASHDGGRWLPDEEDLPTIRKPSPQGIAQAALDNTPAILRPSAS